MRRCSTFQPAFILRVPILAGFLSLFSMGLAGCFANLNNDTLNTSKETGASQPLTVSPFTTKALSPSVALSRTTGVAPLSVFFDATGTTSAITSNPFHKLQYTWDFGDPAGSPVSGTTWSTGARPGAASRNSAMGPVTGHIYENSGTFTPKLTVTDGTNTVVYPLPSVTVYDPNDTAHGFGACPGFRWNSSEGPCLNAGNGYATVA